MKVICTFSGKFGDILWSLVTVKAITQVVGQMHVDMAIMPQYESLLPLIQDQPYIGEAFVIPEWICTGSPHGDQPWLPPRRFADYDRQYHLTYKGHPGITPGLPRMALIDFIAWQQGIKFVQNPVPFIDAIEYKLKVPYIAYAFNSDVAEIKERFLEWAQRLTKEQVPEYDWRDVTKLGWKGAAVAIKNAMAFVGCRSANWVLACGVGQKNIFIYEPNAARNKHGMFGDVFGCPYVKEHTVDPYQEQWANQSLGDQDPGRAAEKFVKLLKSWKEEEISNEQTYQSSSR